jgi:hypothetical protein
MDYERMYYLWKVIRDAPRKLDNAGGMPTREDIVEAAASAYRRGTALLYWSGMARSATALHHLALRCFNTDHLGLQELLEARTCLVALSEDSRAPIEPAWIEEILDLIAIEAVRSAAHADQQLKHDDFFTIPTKVMCRFARSRELYEEICSNHWTPNGSPPPIPDVQVRRAAKRLAATCTRWQARLDDARWNEFCNKASVSRHGINKARDASAAMYEWFDAALVS